jgi:diguanylate cyclase (GGDEF)-like protein
MAEILIVDDEERVRALLSDLLGGSHTCLMAESGERALHLLREHRPAVVISDINMPGINGIELIPLVRETSPDIVVMMISGNQTLDYAIEAMREGAFDFIKKPFEIDQVELAVRRAVEHHELLAAKRLYEQRLEELVEARTEQLEYLAYYDELTGLPNRALLSDRLTRLITTSGEGSSVAVLVMSPDRFRDIRDTLGQEQAELLLKEFARRLRHAFPSESMLARADTDEFAAVLPGVVGTEEIGRFTEQIADTLQAPLTAAGRKIYITASVGASLFPNDGGDGHTILRNAGAALSQAKRNGTRVEFFDRRMRDETMRRLLVENDLRHALARGELAVHYQPKIANLSGKITGFEALARWHHPAGEIGPSEFVPVAESTGTIHELGEWVLNEACQQAMRWHLEGRDLTIAVNVSAAQFDADLAEVVRRAISHSGIDPANLNLEVTESLLMSNASHAIELIKELKETGLKVSIDDFGTGYSSLGQLKLLPIDVLKIDRSFISDIARNADDASLIMGVIGLAHNLNLKVVAEGVETEEQLRFLDLCKCDEWQGFLASRAVPAEAVGRMLTENGSYYG